MVESRWVEARWLQRLHCAKKIYILRQHTESIIIIHTEHTAQLASRDCVFVFRLELTFPAFRNQTHLPPLHTPITRKNHTSRSQGSQGAHTQPDCNQNPRPMRAPSARPFKREADLGHDLGLTAPCRGVRAGRRSPALNQATSVCLLEHGDPLENSLRVVHLTAALAICCRVDV